MQLFASKITIAFSARGGSASGGQDSLKLFPTHKTVWTGNPVRKEMLQGDRAKAVQLFHLEEGIPTLFVTGGGTGAEFLNTLVVESLPELTKFCQVIHLTGREKFCHSRTTPTMVGGEPGIKAGLDSRLRGNDSEEKKRYRSYEFLTSEMPHAFTIADLVICRAGMATFTELVALGKAAIVVPMPGSHQEENAAFFAQRGAVQVAHKASLTTEVFVKNSTKDIWMNQNPCLPILQHVWQKWC